MFPIISQGLLEWPVLYDCHLPVVAWFLSNQYKLLNIFLYTSSVKPVWNPSKYKVLEIFHRSIMLSCTVLSLVFFKMLRASSPSRGFFSKKNGIAKPHVVNCTDLRVAHGYYPPNEQFWVVWMPFRWRKSSLTHLEYALELQRLQLGESFAGTTFNTKNPGFFEIIKSSGFGYVFVKAKKISRHQEQVWNKTSRWCYQHKFMDQLSQRSQFSGNHRAIFSGKSTGQIGEIS